MLLLTWISGIDPIIILTNVSQATSQGMAVEEGPFSHWVAFVKNVQIKLTKTNAIVAF